ncbi:MAG TPA: lipid-binding SYLF domain-containing protein [Terriglobales bacterium]|nr:lipid-binding SYLF domain-containing protein [Terriglobales bacterium]
MKKTALSVVFAFIALGLVGCARHEHTTRVNSAGQPVTEARADVLNRMSDAGKVLNELTSASDQNIPENVLKDAKCVAIVPDMVKGGFVIGGQHGRGVATCRTANGWSAPAFFTLTGGSWGAQIGAESVDLVMLVMNDKGMQQLLSANWKLGGEGSVAAGPVGRDASANTDWKLRAQILTYSRTRGLFAGLTLNGANVRQDDDSTRAFYGKDYDFRTLLAGNVRPPTQAQDFLASIRRNFREANAAQ